MVDCGEFGSGGKGVVVYALEVLLAATTTGLVSFSYSSSVLAVVTNDDDEHTGIAVLR